MILKSDLAKMLYESVKDLPVHDFHCHLSAEDIWQDEPFETITKLWIDRDNYIWRIMRYAGIEEKYITGNASEFDKFKMFAGVVSKLVGSPLSEWCRAQLLKFFDISLPLCSENAKAIYDECNRIIKEKNYSPSKILSISNIKFLGTTEDPLDNLEYHKKMSKRKNDIKIHPTFRSDNAVSIEKREFPVYVNDLSHMTGIPVNSYTGYLAAMQKRIEYFVSCGCLSSDHLIEDTSGELLDDRALEKIYQKAFTYETLTVYEISSFKISTIRNLAAFYNEYGLVSQLHIGALKNNNTRTLKKLGQDIGSDTPNDFRIISKLTAYLSSLNRTKSLPKTIIYNANEKDSHAIAVACGNYSKPGSPGHVQHGAAWWHLNSADGIKNQLSVIKNLSMLPYFIGMPSESLSFLSFIRHDWFRCILADFIAKTAEEEAFTNENVLKSLMADISYNNAERFFSRII